MLGNRYLCKWLGVTERGFYAWRNRDLSNRYKADQELLKLIKRIFYKHDGIYGSPRIFKVLKRLKIRVGRKRVERLMREAGLVGKVFRSYRRTPGTKKFYLKHKNLKLSMTSSSLSSRCLHRDEIRQFHA